MGDVDIDELERLHGVAAQQVGCAHWLCGTEREDGTAQVYAPNNGPLRVIVPIADTSPEHGHLIVAMRNALPALIAELRELRSIHAECVKGPSRATLTAERDAARAEVEQHRKFHSDLGVPVDIDEYTKWLETGAGFDPHAVAVGEQGERAAIVAWLREESTDAVEYTERMAIAIDRCADMIERGEHRSGGKEDS